MIYKKIKASMPKKLISLFLVLVLSVLVMSPLAGAKGLTKTGTNYPTVFVAGYAGYGQYDKMNESFQYWGMQSGDLVKYLNAQGYESYAASVDPVGSAWDRACELYAQLMGTVVDYGQVHSALYKHSRFGTDYSKNPLFTGWGEQQAAGGIKKVNFMCHSFGGATVRLLAELLANGSPEETGGTNSGMVSGLFTGGKTDWVYSISTFASPHDGSTVLNLTKPFASLWPANNTKIVGSPISTNFGVYNYIKNMSKLLHNGIGEDSGVYDLSLDGAAKLNKKLSVLPNIYYFSFATDATAPALLSNNRVPDLKLTDLVFIPTSFFMGSTTGVSDGGIVFDDSWFQNDGIVNTISSKAPRNEAQKTFDANNVVPGIWNIMNTFKGDHASVIGGFIRAVDINPMYLAQVKLINSL